MCHLKLPFAEQVEGVVQELEVPLFVSRVERENFEWERKTNSSSTCRSVAWAGALAVAAVALAAVVMLNIARMLLHVQSLVALLEDEAHFRA